MYFYIWELRETTSAAFNRESERRGEIRNIYSMIVNSKKFPMMLHFGLIRFSFIKNFSQWEFCSNFEQYPVNSQQSSFTSVPTYKVENRFQYCIIIRTAHPHYLPVILYFIAHSVRDHSTRTVWLTIHHRPHVERPISTSVKTITLVSTHSVRWTTDKKAVKLFTRFCLWEQLIRSRMEWGAAVD